MDFLYLALIGVFFAPWLWILSRKRGEEQLP